MHEIAGRCVWLAGTGARLCKLVTQRASLIRCLHYSGGPVWSARWERNNYHPPNATMSTDERDKSGSSVGIYNIATPPHETEEQGRLYIARPQLVTALRMQRALTASEWTDLKAVLTANGYSITNRNFEGNAMGGCIDHRNYEAGKSLMDYLRNCNKKPNFTILSRYIRLCGECFEQSSEQEILSCYKELRDEAPVLDASSLQNVICGLAKTSKWKECLKLIEEIKYSAVPKSLVYGRVAAAAFANNELDLGWSLLETTTSRSTIHVLPIGTEAFLQWLQLIDGANDEKTESEMLDRFVDFCCRHQLSLPMSITERIRQYFDRKEADQWEGDYTTIQLNGVCRRCDTSLESVEINEEEFGLLREEFMKNVVAGDDPYAKSSPRELENFKYFISKTAPYDVVMDGLNVAFHDADRKTTAEEKATTLFEMVRELVERRKARVLVLGRAHMSKWPKRIMSYIQKNTHCFFASNLSKDDPLLLYAAMHSGLGTYIVSRDLMRDHKFCLHNTHLSALFRRWQMCRQLGFKKDRQTNKFQLMDPVLYNPVIQKTNNTLHIPCNTSNSAVYLPDLPPRWLCISKSSLPNSVSVKRAD